MRRPNLAAVKDLLIIIRVTLRTRREGTRFRTKLHALMLGMTINTTYTRGFVRLDQRRRERFSVVTRSTPLFHAARQRMTVCTRAGVWRCSDCGNDAELRQRVRLRDRRGRESTRIPVSCGYGNQPYNQQRPGEKRDRPARPQIRRRHPVVLRFASAPATFRKKR